MIFSKGNGVTWLMFTYDPSLAPILDWLAVFGYLGFAAFITWQVVTRSK